MVIITYRGSLLLNTHRDSQGISQLPDQETERLGMGMYRRRASEF